MRNYSFFGKRNIFNAKPLLQVALEWPSALAARPLPASMKPTLQALESWLHGVPVGFPALYNMEGPEEEPSCTISWHLQKPPLQALEGPGEEAS